MKKAIKLKSNEGLYNYFYGLSLWNWARAVRSGKSSSTFSGTDDLMDKGDQYVKRAAELMPDDVNVQMAAGTIAENYANYLARSGGYRSYINEEYQRAYQHFRRAAELDPSKGENQTRFANEHPGYGFQPYKPATPPATQPTPDTPNATRSQGDAWEDIGDDIPPRNESVRPGAVEFLPIGWSQGFVAIWKSRPGSLGGEYSMRVGGFIDGRHTTEIEGFNFDVIGYDENEKPNKFRLCYTQDGRPHGYAYLITVENLKTITVERLAYDGTGLEEWGRKRDNPAYEVPIPPVEQQSPACPYPKETYILARIKESERHRLTEKAWGSKLWPEYLFVSENAEQYGLDGYTCTDSWGSTSTKACYLSPNFSGPMAEALIAFWETDGEVEDYPSDAGDVAFEITQG